MSDKVELLEELDKVLKPKKRLDFIFLLYVLSSIMFVGVFAFPKIFIQQQIYLKSRDIHKLKGEYDTLKEENRVINSSVEYIRFKNNILDTIF